ncbi:MAG: hypothetical protein V4574_17805 [Pseudomonadota bacterium]
MTRTTMGEGERAEARQRRRQLVMLAGSVVVALSIVALAAIFKQSGGRIAPAGGIAIAAVYLVASGLSVWRSCRLSDEVEIRHTRRAVMAGFFFYFLTYPAWYFLWKGGLVIEPLHEAMFAGTVFAVMTAYLWNKFRG